MHAALRGAGRDRRRRAPERRPLAATGSSSCPPSTCAPTTSRVGWRRRRPAGRAGARDLLLGHRRRERPHAARRVPGRLPRPAGRAGGGVLPAGTGRGGDAGRRHDRLDRGPSCSRSTDAKALARYASGPLAGVPATTRREIGSGAAWYVRDAARPGRPDRAADPGAVPLPGCRRTVAGTGGGRGRAAGERRARRGSSCSTTRARPSRCAVRGYDLVGEQEVDPLVLDAGRVAVVREG